MKCLIKMVFFYNTYEVRQVGNAKIPIWKK